ncbi:stalk domain-containing protein [Calidifontibacillus erzurumensis]|uniref:Copper amine oxidase N-terminal domain-containing protein n=1 Tax=Calidifontibacillus erzurumensis TaxID=2741433 RepID=A0A8J8GH24_9BACI|nr:stalk domain-containing protein [Calidifontibacillus erzurumensis]NSL51646.1 copper amine oxidase N-terminal domain-containing protein [Calidifontibacillus erzurumensis]
MGNWKKTTGVLSASMLLAGALFTSSVEASQATKKVDVHYKDIKIINNGVTIEIDPKTEPFILNGVTYIPLRMMGELYNKTVQWSAPTSTIIIKDQTPPISQATVDALNAQIKAKDAKIAELEAEIEKLKAAAKKVDLDDLEDDLNDDYYDYFGRDVDDIEILLSGNEKKIDVRIDVNGNDWNKVKESKKLSFLQDIVDDILAKLKDADIQGTVKDAKNGKLLDSFSLDSKDNVKLDKKKTDFSDLEDELNDWYFDYYSDLDDVEISLDGDEDEIDLTIEVEGDDWEALTDKQKLNFLQDIVDDILYEYKRAEIYGIVKDDDNGKRLDTFYADGSDDGKVEID